MKKLLQSLFVIFLCVNFAMAQNRTITETVTSTDDNLPIPGVNVKIKGTSIGTIPEAYGKFNHYT